MKLVILGSGTSVPHAQRSSSAYWLETGGGSLLLDISADAAHRMAQEYLDWPNLDAIWVSHFHLDHVGGLAPFLFGTKWAPQTQERRKPLRIFGGKGLKEVIEAYDQAGHYKLLDQAFEVEVVEVQTESTFQILPGLTARVLATPHTKESLAIRLIDLQGKTFVYTSDTGPSDKLPDLARNVDLLLMECSFRTNKPIQNHLELTEAMELVRQAAPKLAVLTHFYPDWDSADIVAEAKSLWPGEVIAALDGLRLEI